MTISISEVRKHLTDLATRVLLRGERVAVQRRGKNLFALVPVGDVATLERLEDQRDVRLARKAMKEGGPNIPWEKAKRRLGPSFVARIRNKGRALCAVTSIVTPGPHGPPRT